MRRLDWYFDFVSGFAYLQFETLDRLPEDVEIVFRPVLFAGLLNHFGHKGPAEIAEKRRFTYSHWAWLAAAQGVPFRMPPAHPFNPLAPLRLAVALGCERHVIATIFRFIWRDGNDIETAASWRQLTERLGVADADARIGDPGVKAGLREATRQAAARGVFGVPTCIVDDELFWGADATQMLLDFLGDAGFYRRGELARAREVPVGTARKQSA